MQTNEAREFNRDDYLLITNEHCSSARVGRTILVASHCMTLDSIVKSQVKLHNEVRKHALLDGVGIAFRSDIVDCFNIGGEAKVHGSAGYQVYDAVTVWLLYLRGYVAYDFVTQQWVVREAQAHALVFETQNIAALIEREGGITRH